VRVGRLGASVIATADAQGDTYRVIA